MKKMVLLDQKTEHLITRLMKCALLLRTPVLVAFFLLLPAYVLAQQEIIIDHTSTNISDIPADWISVVKNMTLHHTGQSHGRQVPHGLSNLENQNSTYDQTQSEGGIPSGNGLKITRGQRTRYNSYTVSVGPERFWLGDSGLDYTRRTLDYHLDNGNTIDASLHTWCWHLRSWSASQVEDYSTSMEQLESEYPDVTFIYMTDTCDKSGSSGYNRFLRNEQIREYCRENNKVLFDFADLESWSADGSHQNTYSYGGISNIPLIHSDWESGSYYDDGHINEAACTMKAKAMWWLLARIAGWDGSPEETGRDGDTEGIADNEDNCIDTPNPDQEDADNDSIGDACDPDTVYGTVSQDVQSNIIYGAASDDVQSEDSITFYRFNCGENFEVNSAIINSEGYYSLGGLESGVYIVVQGDIGSSVKFFRIEIPQEAIQSYDFETIAD